MFKMLNNEDLFELSDKRCTRGHSRKLKIGAAHNNIRQHSFALRNVAAWNSIPEEVVSAEALNIFKSKIDQYFDANLHVV